MTPQDLDHLRAVGLSDAEIHDAVQIISYFNYINRLADALGCDPEPWMKKKMQE
jgi:alkylhydroperoxidase family enzyme